MKKKTFLILLVSSLFLQSSFCQKKLEYGINAGINYTNLRGNTSLENLNSDFGYLIGKAQPSKSKICQESGNFFWGPQIRPEDRVATDPRKSSFADTRSP